jgi:hypothetical protein
MNFIALHLAIRASEASERLAELSCPNYP